MKDTISNRRQAENEAVFRKYNERVKEGFDELKDIAKEEGQEQFAQEIDYQLHFYCECADENCRERVLIKPSEYTKIHRNRNHFVIIEGHDSDAIERIILKRPTFWIVEKFIRPSETGIRLHATDVDNV